MNARSLAPTFLALLASVAGPAVSHAQTPPERPPFSSDRPGVGNGASVMAPGLWQAEVGGTFRGEGNDEFLVGDALVRMAFAGVEARVTLPAAYVRHAGGFLQLGDVGLGVKAPLELGGDWWKWAAMGTLKLPTGSESVNAPSAGFDGLLIGEVELEGDVSLEMNAGWGFLFDDLGGGALSLVATPTFPFPAGEGLRGYAGLATRIRSGDDELFVEWGVTRMMGADRQWDVNAGYDPGSHTWFLGIGVADRRSW